MATNRTCDSKFKDIYNYKIANRKLWLYYDGKNPDDWDAEGMAEFAQKVKERGW